MIDSNEERSERMNGARILFVNVLLMTALALGLAMPSWAEAPEAGDAEAAEAAGPDYVPCAELARVKYPFMRCVRGPSGRPVFAAEGPGMTGARLKLGSSYASGAGGWGDSGIE